QHAPEHQDRGNARERNRHGDSSSSNADRRQRLYKPKHFLSFKVGEATRKSDLDPELDRRHTCRAAPELVSRLEGLTGAPSVHGRRMLATASEQPGLARAAEEKSNRCSDRIA